mmetsp:Transcript_22625/g.30223  ORF Transcript_22625/g.30223 Transcript_22625/m.30223 type:complete len:82 (-) Transcript_22625:53-298(-)
MLSRIVRRPVQTVARRNMSLFGAKKQDIAASQKNNLEMGLRWTFLRGGKKDDVVITAAIVMGLGIFVSVGRGFYRMATGQK